MGDDVVEGLTEGQARGFPYPQSIAGQGTAVGAPLHFVRQGGHLAFTEPLPTHLPPLPSTTPPATGRLFDASESRFLGSFFDSLQFGLEGELDLSGFPFQFTLPEEHSAAMSQAVASASAAGPMPVYTPAQAATPSLHRQNHPQGPPPPSLVPQPPVQPLPLTRRQVSPTGTASHRTSTARSAPPSRPKKPPKVLLTEAQKRRNHILSEKRRRTILRLGFKELTHLLPTPEKVNELAGAPTAAGAFADAVLAKADDGQGGEEEPEVKPMTASGAGVRSESKSGVLFRAVEFVRYLDGRLERLEAEIARLEKG